MVMIMNSNIITNKTVRKIQEILLHYFLSSVFIDTVFFTLFNIVFVTFIISSSTIIKSSRILFKYVPFSQVHVLGFHT